MSRLAPIALLALIAALPACVNMNDDDDKHRNAFAGADASASGESRFGSVNKSISIRSGEKADDVSTVNGSITIERDAFVGSANTVNGGISLASGATARSLNTVNGGISLDDGARVTGDVSTVNGSLTVEEDADVGGNLSNVNGHIRLDAAHVGGMIQTSAGDIDVGENSRVDGGILVKRNSSPLIFRFGKKRVPRIVIGPGATVGGTLKFEQEVELYVSDTATIGAVEGATAVRFSGENAPG